MANRILSFVAALGEVCSRDNIIPEYDLLKVEGPCHDPVFIIHAVAGKYHADGRGSKKQTAKQEAAKQILLDMGELSLEDLKIMESKVGFESAKVIGNVVDGCLRNGSGALPIKDKERNRNTFTPIPVTNQLNPLGDLIEISLIMGWPHPKVVDEQKTGPAHDPRFTVSCYFAKFKTFATSKSKKEAKRLAALEMHENMRYQPEIMYKYSIRTGRPMDPSSVWNNDFELMGSEPYASGVDFCYSGVPKILEIAGAHSIDMLKGILSVDEIANPEIFLRSIIKECHFEMQFESLMEDLTGRDMENDGDIPQEIATHMLRLPFDGRNGDSKQRDTDDEEDADEKANSERKERKVKLRDMYTVYCILKLPIKNPVRLLGYGLTPENARYSAARRALLYLRVMALKDPV